MSNAERYTRVAVILHWLICSQVHYVTVIIFMTLIAIHVAASVKHMIARDGVIQRMWR